jgi:NADPH-dependent curcumin reductase CurA
MTDVSNNQAWRLRRRPVSGVAAGDLELVSEPIAPLEEGQALVRTLVLSVEAASRIWMGHQRAFMPPVGLNEVMRGIGVGEVVESRRDDMKIGDIVAGFLGWQEYCCADDQRLDAPLTVLPSPLPAPVSAFTGILGHTAITAYLGIEYLQPKPGQTVVVSAAAGGVGSIAGQLARLRGARVVGIAGGAAKCQHVIDDLGFDACVDRKDPAWPARLDEATPDGVDLDFENVGGPILDHLLMRLNLHAKILLCGEVSSYDDSGERSAWRGLVNVDQVHMQRATMQGFIVTDHLARWPAALDALGGLWASGQLKYEESVVSGLDQAPAALTRLLAGETVGKLVVGVAEPVTIPGHPLTTQPSLRGHH